MKVNPYTHRHTHAHTLCLFVLRHVPVCVVGFLSSDLTLESCILFSVMMLIKTV